MGSIKITIQATGSQGQDSSGQQKSHRYTRNRPFSTYHAVFNASSKSCFAIVGGTAHGQKRRFFGIRKTRIPQDEHFKRSGRRRSERTSRMLVGVLVLFLLSEFPQGIMGFLSGLYGVEFFRKCYNAFAEIWDILALINSASNFMLYCFMSQQFRVQFRKFFPITHPFTRGKYGEPGQGNWDANNANNATLV